MYYHGSWTNITMIVKVCDRESRRDSWFENRLVDAGVVGFVVQILICMSRLSINREFDGAIFLYDEVSRNRIFPSDLFIRERDGLGHVNGVDMIRQFLDAVFSHYLQHTIQVWKLILLAQ